MSKSSLLSSLLVILLTGRLLAQQKEIQWDKLTREQLDSLRIVYEKQHTIEQREKAKIRLEDYKINTKKDTLVELNLSHSQLSNIPEFVGGYTNIKKN